LVAGLAATKGAFASATGSMADASIPIRPDLTVAADGGGDFTTIQAALDSIPAGNRERRIIFIKDGIYHEKIRIDPAFVTLRGQSRQGTRIEFAQGAEEFRRQPDQLGIGVVNINGDDCIIRNLTVQNTHGVIGVHAFAIHGVGDRTVITDCDVLSQGNDTLSLWKAEGGRYYHARLNIRGSVDFVCPRGWCYMTDCTFFEVNPHAEAAIWHDGSKARDMKFVLRDCRFDGVEGWRLARHHHDAQFFLLDCTFSPTMRDLAPRRVVYPLNGKAPTEADIQRNQGLAATNQWGERAYYHDCHRAGGDYAWFKDNLASAPGAPKPEQVTAAWTFGGTWDPESTARPVVQKLEWKNDLIAVTFSDSVTVKGKPQLILRSGAPAGYLSGSGGDTLVFAAPAGPHGQVAQLDLQGGAILATAATATQRVADVSLR
jgi:pectinesterase